MVGQQISIVEAADRGCVHSVGSAQACGGVPRYSAGPQALGRTGRWLAGWELRQSIGTGLESKRINGQDSRGRPGRCLGVG